MELISEIINEKNKIILIEGKLVFIIVIVLVSNFWPLNLNNKLLKPLRILGSHLKFFCPVRMAFLKGCFL